MGKRKFSIFVYKDYDWELGLEDVESFDAYPHFGGNIEYGFAKSRAIQDKKIAYLFDSVLQDDDLEKAKNDERFQEVCDFKMRKTNKDNTEINSDFTGNFVDALEHIKKALEDERG